MFLKSYVFQRVWKYRQFFQTEKERKNVYGKNGLNTNSLKQTTLTGRKLGFSGIPFILVYHR